jgi:RNA polymerase sigma factor (TIGR02999 family)
LEPDLNALIARADQMDPAAADRLFATLYAELHRLAEHHLRRNDASLTLGTTTLLHEAYLNIAKREDVVFPDQGRFLAYASRAMRGLVIDYVRARRAIKRGVQFEITLTGDPSDAINERDTLGELTRLSDALDQLATLNPSLSELVDLHFFCGFSFQEIASFRSVSDRTIKREWRKARLLLHGMIDEALEDTSAS